MKKVLYIGWCMPYDSVAHAGGQIFNYYVKAVSKVADVKLITIALPGEKQKATLYKYGVDAKYIEFEKISLLRKFKSLNSRYNPWHCYGHIVTQYKVDSFVEEAKKVKKEGFEPDVIVLQWTQVILMVDEIRKIFPNAKYIAVEEDVTFLRLQREFEAENGIKRLYRRAVYDNERKRELIALEKFDFVYTNNQKDRKLLLNNGFCDSKIKVLVPYYHKYSGERSMKTNNDLLFFGNMGRPENYNAVIDFIEHILPRIKTNGVRFVVVGGNEEKIKKYKSEKVVITGYVEKPDIYFANSALFVAPIKQGAGIKIKVLEAMSSGIPVITTDVGIEGIPAEDGKSYFHYKNNEELISCIERLLNNKIEARKIGDCGKILVNQLFDFEASVNEYTNVLMTL